MFTSKMPDDVRTQNETSPDSTPQRSKTDRGRRKNKLQRENIQYERRILLHKREYGDPVQEEEDLVLSSFPGIVDHTETALKRISSRTYLQCNKTQKSIRLC